MNEQKPQKLKFLLDQVPPGFLIDSGWLKTKDIARSSTHDYVRRGWLEPVTRGVYRRPFLPNISESQRTGWLLPVLSIQHLLDYDMHLGGPSALNEQGHVHYLRARGKPPIYLYGELPTWLDRLDVDAVFIERSNKLFGGVSIGIENSATKESTASAPQSWQLRMSMPERAILEALDELPNQESFHNLDMIFEGLVNLRPKLLNECLTKCNSVKVKRLFFVYADKHAHAWWKHIDKSRIDLGAGPRALVKGGKFHPKYEISVPEDLIPSKQEGGDYV